MIASERRRHILSSLNSRGVISLKDMAAELSVAEITVRRDIEKLEAEGKLKRVQGGATSLEDPDGAELTMKQKLPIHTAEKAIVAGYAANLVQDGDTVFLDGGTTMMPLAVLLMQRHVNIVTYNTMFLAKNANPAARIFLIGGEYSPHYEMNVGLIAQDLLKQFYFDVAFFGCSGVDLEKQTVCSTEMQSLAMKRVALEQATKKYLLMDSSKFTMKSFMRVCSITQFDAVVCDKYVGRPELRPENLIVVSEQGYQK